MGTIEVISAFTREYALPTLAKVSKLTVVRLNALGAHATDTINANCSIGAQPIVITLDTLVRFIAK